MATNNNSILSGIVPDNVTINVNIDRNSIIYLCVGILIVILISLFVWGIIKKGVK